MKKTLFIILCIGALLLAACGGQQAAAPQSSGGGTPAPTQSGSPPGPTEDPAAAPTDAPTDTPTSAPVAEATAVDIANISQGLDALDSYRAEFTYSFQGNDNGNPVTEELTYSTEYVREPAAQRITTGSSTNADQTFEIIIAGGQNYMTIGDQCVSSATTDDSLTSGTFEPSDFVGDISGNTLLGRETVNGVETNHFRANLPITMILTETTSSNVEFWVADQGYLIKYVMEATGRGQGIFGTSAGEGILRFEYNVLDINQPISITPPDGCGGAPADVPVLPDAQNMATFGELITYTSATSLEEASEFYNAQMAANGWSAQPGAGGVPGFAQLTFTKGGRTAAITITSDPSTNTTSVLIQLSGE